MFNIPICEIQNRRIFSLSVNDLSATAITVSISELWSYRLTILCAYKISMLNTAVLNVRLKERHIICRVGNKAYGLSFALKSDECVTLFSVAALVGSQAP